MNKLGVAGSGNMGNGIGQTAAQNGYDVILYDVSDAQLEKAKESIANALRKRVEKGKMEQEVMDKTLEAIRYTTNITDLGDRDVIVEAVVEKVEVKQGILPSWKIWLARIASSPPIHPVFPSLRLQPG